MASPSPDDNLYTVILPTYNERENLPILVWLLDKTFTQHALKYEIVIVDDNSPDGTQAMAEELQRVFGPEKIILHPRPGKLGLGTAYLHGLEVASGNFIFLMDADLSHDPKFIPEFIKTQKALKCDIVTGTRYTIGSGIHGWSLYRKLTSRVANFIADTLLDPQVTDLTGSYRLYKRSVLEHLIDITESKGYGFQMEVAVRASRFRDEALVPEGREIQWSSAEPRNTSHRDLSDEITILSPAGGYRIAEVPITFVDRLYGQSKLGPNEITAYLKGVWRLFMAV
ncbi:dolichol-phosphate mannosyltransferase [Fonticula alba]|uniref:Dolichol-phosphate mannosyltransferase subunit 1 n=1 Tax=Fonticula alba TaxID=691883 RepID=A0A058ZI75_FONAL|nr:dolichol-phosphate mannosyltransferase [Fonticula alba]KCV73227.1 dolichol-phosphate mannosyltransferase [Fonticula alba]|eukprot:XP_009492928.1 dolichol-phosphate mannosyltransferase [Fonticula alba]